MSNDTRQSVCGSGATEESAPQNCEHLGIFRKDSQGTMHADKALQKNLRQKSSGIKASVVRSCSFQVLCSGLQ